MKNHVWGWAVGCAIFAAIVGVWVWQFPNIVRHTARGSDEGLNGIMSVFSGARNSVSADLLKAQTQLDSNLEKVSEAISVQKAQAEVIKDMKDKISGKDAIKAAGLPVIDMNVPAETAKPQTKK